MVEQCEDLPLRGSPFDALTKFSGLQTTWSAPNRPVIGWHELPRSDLTANNTGEAINPLNSADRR
ncbi:hypothetical protein EYF80_003702 [Liparis tanakae]|uniref:Uncharacterized protein n=1 Tax=Liparis tanakae TaxID=230148 RepID=A0A4Z2J831_9TELE|nr:hypothetical protein EYF80_003702 [Liparis tanakae]